MYDPHGTGPRLALDLVQTNLSQKNLFKIWTLNEVGVRYERLECERELHNDRTEIVPNIPESGLAQHGADQLQTGTNAEQSWIRLAMMLTWTCKNADSTMELLGDCSTCQLITVTCNSHRQNVFRADALRFPIPARSDCCFRTPGISCQSFCINKQTKALSPKSWAIEVHDHRK